MKLEWDYLDLIVFNYYLIFVLGLYAIIHSQHQRREGTLLLRSRII